MLVVCPCFDGIIIWVRGFELVILGFEFGIGGFQKTKLAWIALVAGPAIRSVVDSKGVRVSSAEIYQYKD